jgi:hypothetical protein
MQSSSTSRYACGVIMDNQVTWIKRTRHTTRVFATKMCPQQRGAQHACGCKAQLGLKLSWLSLSPRPATFAVAMPELRWPVRDLNHIMHTKRT